MSMDELFCPACGATEGHKATCPTELGRVCDSPLGAGNECERCHGTRYIAAKFGRKPLPCPDCGNSQGKEQ